MALYFGRHLHRSDVELPIKFKDLLSENKRAFFSDETQSVQSAALRVVDEDLPPWRGLIRATVVRYRYGIHLHLHLKLHKG